MKKKLDNNGDNSMLIVKDNALISASYNLDVVEQRLILLAIVEARESGKGINANDALTIHASTYIKNFNVEKHSAYTSLKEASKSLFSRQFSYEEVNQNGNITQYTSRWVSKIGYTKNEASVDLIFAPDVVPLITRLEKHFTSYELSQVAKLGSKYAMRLYELLIAWRATGKLQVELQDLRNKLGLSVTEYKAMGDFKKNVLDLALTQINEHTDITVKYEQHKKGRTISGFTFRFKAKVNSKNIEEKDRDNNIIDMFCHLSDNQIKTYSSILSKVHDISDLAGNKDFQAFGIWISSILRDPKSVREETAKRIFSALHQHTDFKNGMNRFMSNAKNHHSVDPFSEPA